MPIVKSKVQCRANILVACSKGEPNVSHLEDKISHHHDKLPIDAFAHLTYSYSDECITGIGDIYVLLFNERKETLQVAIDLDVKDKMWRVVDQGVARRATLIPVSVKSSDLLQNRHRKLIEQEKAAGRIDPTVEPADAEEGAATDWKPRLSRTKNRPHSENSEKVSVGIAFQLIDTWRDAQLARIKQRINRYKVSKVFDHTNQAHGSGSVSAEL